MDLMAVSNLLYGWNELKCTDELYVNLVIMMLEKDDKGEFY